MNSDQNFIGEALGQNVRDASLDVAHVPELASILGRTNIGSGREKNQDALGAYVDGGSRILLVVADGLGCYQFSERAAYEAVTRVPFGIHQGEDLFACCRRIHGDLMTGWPYQMKVRGNEAAALSASAGDRGATTLVLADIQGDKASIANIGDSRVYLFREGNFIYQSRDQSLVEMLKAEGQLKGEGAERRHPLRSVLLNALGAPEEAYEFIDSKGNPVTLPMGEPIIDEILLERGDVLILATDGTFTNLTDEELAALITGTPWEALEEKMALAIQSILRKGKTTLGENANPDNFTFLLYRHP